MKKSSSNPTKTVASGSSSPELTGTEEVILRQLQELLPPQKASEAAKLVQQLVQINSNTHIGPFFPADQALALEERRPGSIDRMFTSAEKDQDAFIANVKAKQARDHAFRVLALLAGFLGLVLILGAVVYLGINDKQLAAAAVGGMGASGIVAILVNAGSPLRASLGTRPPPKK